MHKICKVKNEMCYSSALGIENTSSAGIFLIIDYVKELIWFTIKSKKYKYMTKANLMGYLNLQLYYLLIY